MTEFYSASEKRVDPPDEEFGLGDISGEVVEQATEVLMFLESIEWRWDINTILEQPAELTRAVMRLRSLGSQIQKEGKKDGIE